MEFKIEQIALGADDPEELMNNLAVLGCKNWVHDRVTATGKVFDLPVKNVADLYFNYDLGFELEVLKYVTGPNWHESYCRPSVFLSHVGMHVRDNSDGSEDIAAAISSMGQKGIEIAQHVYTNDHTNTAIKDSRRYEYVVFDSSPMLGFDVKLIRRIDI